MKKLLLFITSITTAFAADAPSPLTAMNALHTIPEETSTLPRIPMEPAKALKHAVAEGHVDIVREILEGDHRGEDWKLTQADIAEAFMNAILNRKHDVAKYMLSVGNDVFDPSQMRSETRVTLLLHIGNKFPSMQKTIVEGLNWGEFGLKKNYEELRQLANAGWLEAQNIFMMVLKGGNLDGEGRFEPHIKRNLQEVKRLAFAGWEEAQDFIAQGLARDEFGIAQNPAELKRLAYNERWVKAQNYVAEGLAGGLSSRYGIDQDLMELQRLAYEEGWMEAKNLVAHGLAYGCDGIPKDHAQLNILANAGCERAQYYLLDNIAIRDWKIIDYAELRRRADAGWVVAQRLVAEALAEGKEDIRDPAELRHLADAGWVKAQEYIAKGLELGRYGIKQDPEELRRLAILNCRDPDSNYIKRYFITCESLNEILPILIDIDRAAQEAEGAA